MKYQITINFEDLDQLRAFVSDQDKIENLKIKATF
jgi:ribosomal protein S18